MSEGFVDAITDALLDYEDVLQPMSADERAGYRPACRRRAEFIFRRVAEAGWVVRPDPWTSTPSETA